MIKFILCRTQHPGNIGAAARAIDLMGFSELHLVAPETKLSPEAYTRAGRSEQILQEATIHQTLEDALQDVHYVTSCSARPREQHIKVQSPQQTSLYIQDLPQDASAAIVFGPERTGLTNEELLLSHSITQIPCSKNKSLNLSHAVQIMAYQLKISTQKKQSFGQQNDLLTHLDYQKFYQQLEIKLRNRSKLLAHDPDHTLSLLKTLFNRSCLHINEMNLLLGILSE